MRKARVPTVVVCNCPEEKYLTLSTTKRESPRKKHLRPVLLLKRNERGKRVKLRKGR